MHPFLFQYPSCCSSVPPPLPPLPIDHACSENNQSSRPDSLHSTATCISLDSNASIFSAWDDNDKIERNFGSSSSGAPSLEMARSRSTAAAASRRRSSIYHRQTIHPSLTRGPLRQPLIHTADSKECLHFTSVVAQPTEPLPTAIFVPTPSTVSSLNDQTPSPTSSTPSTSTSPTLTSSSSSSYQTLPAPHNHSIKRKPLPQTHTLAFRNPKPTQRPFHLSPPILQEPHFNPQSHSTPRRAPTPPPLVPASPSRDHFTDYDRELGMTVRSYWDDSDSDSDSATAAPDKAERGVVRRIGIRLRAPSKKARRLVSSASAPTTTTVQSDGAEMARPRKRAKTDAGGLWRRTMQCVSLGRGAGGK